MTEIILSAPARSPLSASVVTRIATNSSLRWARPLLLRAYSCATTSSETPHRLRTTATASPERSLPAVQWTRIGDGAGEARCRRMVRNGRVGCVGRPPRARMRL